MTPLDSVIHPKTLVQGGVKKVMAIKRNGASWGHHQSRYCSKIWTLRATTQHVHSAGEQLHPLARMTLLITKGYGLFQKPKALGSSPRTWHSESYWGTVATGLWKSWLHQVTDASLPTCRARGDLSPRLWACQSGLRRLWSSGRGLCLWSGSVSVQQWAPDLVWGAWEGTGRCPGRCTGQGKCLLPGDPATGKLLYCTHCVCCCTLSKLCILLDVFLSKETIIINELETSNIQILYHPFL